MANYMKITQDLGPPETTIVFVYGVFRLSLFCLEQAIPWDMVAPMAQYLAARVSAGLVGLFQLILKPLVKGMVSAMVVVTMLEVAVRAKEGVTANLVGG